jgi:alpha-L-fucosidase
MKTKSRSLLTALAALLAAAGALAQPQPPDPAREKRIAWWREARFGMFIHWGLYAIPAGEWKGQAIPGIGEWIMNRAKIPVREYELLARQFNPVKFNADEWVKLAKAAGQKYIVITSKHHDGFAMYHSRVSRYNIVDATPFGRDVTKELAEACRREGIRLCFYYSQVQDWHHPDGVGNTWDYDESKQNFARYFNELAKPQVREILTQYGPLGEIWFDTPRNISREDSLELVNLVHTLQPACLVNGRVGNDVGDYRSMGDNQIPVKVLDYDWETPVTLNDTWGYKKDDHNWKSTQTLIRQLVDVVSKNGNYLLNVGPTAEGVIPQPSVDRLLEVGRWLKVNGEAVYGAKPSPFPYEFEWGSVTSRPGRLYLHISEWPRGGEFALYGVGGKVKRAYLLARREAALKFTQGRRGGRDELRLQLPSQPPDKDVSVVALDLEGEASFERGLIQQPDGKVTLSCAFADLAGAPKLSVDLRGVATRWFDPGQELRWDFTIYEPGAYEVALLSSEARSSFAGADWEGGHLVKVTVAGQAIEGKVEDQGRRVNARNPRWRDVRSVIGQVRIAKPGRATLSLSALKVQSEKKLGFSLRAVQLVPVAGK